MRPACMSKGTADMTENAVLDGLVEVFPQVNLSTLIEVSISFNGNIDAAADYVIQNVLPNMSIHESNTNRKEDLHIHGHQQVSDGTSTHLVIAPAVNDTLSESTSFDIANKHFTENGGSLMEEQLMQSPAEAFTSGQACLHKGNNSKSLLAADQTSLVNDEVKHIGNQQNLMLFSDHLIRRHSNEQIQCSFSAEEQPALSSFEDNLVLHDNDSPDMNVLSNYSVCIESLDSAISAENHKKNTLLSNVAAVCEMLEVVELTEAGTKHVVSEASQAGNDILVKVKKLKEMSMLAEEQNKKVAGEVFAEKYMIGSEVQGLECMLLNISEERNYFDSIIEEMYQTLQRRLVVAEVEREAAEKEKIKRETMAQELLKEQEGFLDGAEEECKSLEQQAQENEKLRELLMDKGLIMDALHGEMIEIFDNIAQLQYRVDTPLSADEPQKLAASNMSSSAASSAYKLAVNEPVQLALSSLSSSVETATSFSTKRLPTCELIIVDEPLRQASSSLSISVKSAPSKPIPAESTFSSSAKSAPSKLTVGGPLQLATTSLSSSVASPASKLPVDGPLQLASSSLSSSVTSPASKLLVLASSTLSNSATSSASEYSCSSSKCSSDGKIADASCHGNFGSEDSWDVVVDE